MLLLMGAFQVCALSSISLQRLIFSVPASRDFTPGRCLNKCMLHLLGAFQVGLLLIYHLLGSLSQEFLGNGLKTHGPPHRRLLGGIFEGHEPDSGALVPFTQFPIRVSEHGVCAL